MFDPMSVNSPADLPAPLPVVVESRGSLSLHARQPLLYSFHWLREVALGVMEGDLGLNVDAGGEVAASLVLKAGHRREISLDEHGRLRLRILKLESGSLDCAARVSVKVQAATPLPPRPDALVAAILGVHENQWLKAVDRIGAAAPDAVRQLLRLWSSSSADTAASLAAFQEVDGWVRQQIEGLFGPVRTASDVSRLLEGLRALAGLREPVYQKAVAALEQKHAVQLSARYSAASRDTALVDCSFAFTAEGLSAYRKALGGDYSWMLDTDSRHAEVRQGVLTSGLTREASVELHLPFFDRRAWVTRLESLARMAAASDADGRVLLYTVEASHRVESRNSYQSVLALAGGLSVGRVHTKSSFTLSYTDRRSLPRARLSGGLSAALAAYGFESEARQALERVAAEGTGEVDVSLALAIPGALVERWLEAPGERAPEFFDVYSRVSVAVQRAMRLWLPYIYFSDLARYETLEAAFPLLIYQVSRPFPGRPKYDFNYDVLSEDSMRSFFRAAGQLLAPELARVQELLLDAGKRRTAAFYHPRRVREILASVESRRRLLNSLLVADAFLVDALVNLGCRGRQLREDASKNPASAVRGLSRFAADLVKAFHGRLRRLYGGQEFLAFGGLLLVEATNALNAAAGAPSGIRASLRLTPATAGGPEESGYTLVNAAAVAGGGSLPEQ